MKIKIKDKILEVEEMKGFKKITGLMFRKNSKPLLFKFDKPTREPIHSFFCRPFYAIWRRDGKIIKEMKVRPFRISIRPKEPFTELIEIPINRYPRR